MNKLKFNTAFNTKKLLAVHGRKREQKGPDTGLASWKHIKAIKDAVKIPVFANGNILCFEDVLECLKQTGCDGVMVAEPNLYNPALFSNTNPPTWNMAIEYMSLVEQFERHTLLRDKMAKLRDIDEVKETIKEIETLIKSEASYEEIENKNELAYWRCQSYIRSLSSQVAIKQNEEMAKSIHRVVTTDEIEKHLDAINNSLNSESIDDEEKKAALKLAKLLERKKRKLERIERRTLLKTKLEQSTALKKPLPRYIICKSCPNPKSQNCEYDLCRSCCKEKVFTQDVECKGHGLKTKKKTESNNLDT